MTNNYPSTTTLIVPPGPAAARELAAFFPPHWRPVIEAAEKGVVVWQILPNAALFAIPRDIRGLVIISGDLPRNPCGPAAFDRLGLVKLLQDASWIVLMVGMRRDVYEMAAERAVLDQGNSPIVILETRPEYEHEWIALLVRSVSDPAKLTWVTAPPPGMPS